MPRLKRAWIQWVGKVHKLKLSYYSLEFLDTLQLMLFKEAKMSECRTATALGGIKCLHLPSANSSCQMITVWILLAMMESLS